MSLLPVGIVGGDAGHNAAHNTLHAAHNYDDYAGRSLRVSAKRNNTSRLTGDGVTNDTAAFDALVAALWALAPQRFTVVFERGKYLLDPQRHIPWNVSLECEDDKAATFVNTGTTPLSFLIPVGSFFSCKGLVIDAKKANIALPNAQMDAFLAMNIFGRISNSGGGTPLTGGLTLAAGASAGATTITVTSSYVGTATAGNQSPILPGAIINICQGALYERLRVHESYVFGSTTVPLEGQLVNSYTTAANLSMCMTDVEVSDCLFYGAGVQGMCMFNPLVTRNTFVNQIDCCLGNYQRGSYGGEWSHNNVETYSYWAAYFDDASSDGIYPPNEDIAVTDNNMRFLRGGPDVGTGIGTGNRDLIAMDGVRRPIIARNVLDIRAGAAAAGAHVAGIRLNPATQRARCSENTIIGANQTNSFGILAVTLAGTDYVEQQHINNYIESCVTGIDLGQSVAAQVIGNMLRACSGFGIAQTYVRTDAVPAVHVIDANHITSAGYGIRLVGSPTAPAGSGYRGQNVIQYSTTLDAQLANGFVYNPAGQVW